MSTNAADPSSRPAPNTGGNEFLTFLKNYWLPILLVIVALVFIFTNREPANVTIVAGTVSMPLWLALAVTTLIGFVAGWFFGRRGAKNKQK